LIDTKSPLTYNYQLLLKILNLKIMICIPIVSKTTKDAIKDMARAEEFADLIEIRADYIKDLDLVKILAANSKPLIVTITPKN
jgi:3-dehydroquinate dehydratase